MLLIKQKTHMIKSMENMESLLNQFKIQNFKNKETSWYILRKMIKSLLQQKKQAQIILKGMIMSFKNYFNNQMNA